MTAVDREFQKAMDRFRGADGIVIDLRGNPGGLAAMIMGLAGHFLHRARHARRDEDASSPSCASMRTLAS